MTLNSTDEQKHTAAPLLRVNINSRFPLFIEADCDSFGAIFASMCDDEQVQVLRSMVEHMKPHPTQWDFISIELEKDENRELRDQLREVLFPRGEDR